MAATGLKPRTQEVEAGGSVSQSPASAVYQDPISKKQKQTKNKTKKSNSGNQGRKFFYKKMTCTLCGDLVLSAERRLPAKSSGQGSAVLRSRGAGLGDLVGDMQVRSGSGSRTAPDFGPEEPLLTFQTELWTGQTLKEQFFVHGQR